MDDGEMMAVKLHEGIQKASMRWSSVAGRQWCPSAILGNYIRLSAKPGSATEEQIFKTIYRNISKTFFFF